MFRHAIILSKIFFLFSLVTFFYNLIIDEWRVWLDVSYWTAAVCHRLSANLHDRDPNVARRHMMSVQFEVDNKRNSATPRTIRDRSQLLRQHCAGWWVCRNVETKTCLVINTNLSYGQLSNEIDDDFISARASPPHSSKRVTAAAVSKNDEESLAFFLPMHVATLLA